LSGAAERDQAVWHILKNGSDHGDLPMVARHLLRENLSTWNRDRKARAPFGIDDIDDPVHVSHAPVSAV